MVATLPTFIHSFIFCIYVKIEFKWGPCLYRKFFLYTNVKLKNYTRKLVCSLNDSVIQSVVHSTVVQLAWHMPHREKCRLLNDTRESVCLFVKSGWRMRNSLAPWMEGTIGVNFCLLIGISLLKKVTRGFTLLI